MEKQENKQPEVGTFACTYCGADLKYKPGTKHLKCEYCGATNDIPQFESEIEELDFEKFAAETEKKEEHITASFVKCSSCGASSTLEPNVTSASCPYCATPLVVTDAAEQSVVSPKSLLPFKIDKQKAKEEFNKWVKKLWFAPNKLKKATLNFEHFKGIYIPYWTFDTDSHSEYIGQRGEHYYVTESYSTTENGKSVTKTRQVQKTRWYSTSGKVDHFFDDILVVATKSLPTRYINKLEPWDLENLVPFDKNYLSGFIAERYQVELAEGFEIAKDIADAKIRELVRRHIGGDEQRITALNTDFKSTTFKHILLPVYVSAFKFKDKVYQFLVNGRTGEVQGERPYSTIKVVLAILAGLIIAGVLYALFSK